MTPLRLSTAAFLLAALSACGGGDLAVRDGPQAVHPSPSPLAQGIVTETECGHSYHHCSAHHHHAHHKYHAAADGSQPIVD